MVLNYFKTVMHVQPHTYFKENWDLATVSAAKIIAEFDNAISKFKDKAFDSYWQKSDKVQGQIESRCDGEVSQNKPEQWKVIPKGFFTQSRREGGNKTTQHYLVKGDVYPRVRDKLVLAYKRRLEKDSCFVIVSKIFTLLVLRRLN